MSLPFSPKQMKGKPQNIQLRFCAISPFDVLLNTNNLSAPGYKFKYTKFSNIEVEVIPVAQNPLSPGHQVF